MNPFVGLKETGQSVWLDYIRRGLITSGELQSLVDEDGLAGVTSNPAIFQKAITGSSDYTDLLDRLRYDKQLDAKALYEKLAVRDVRDAADVLAPIHEATGGRDGYVSLEVSPYLAHDTDGTVTEARKLWEAVGRKNLMIKVPATPEGLPAVRQLISEGINVNVTLIFSREIYRPVAEAYFAGLEDLAGEGGDVGSIGSVASFFLSRIDTAVDAVITGLLESVIDTDRREELENIRGKVAVANAKLIYQDYKKIFRGKRWDALSASGAKTQRVLWASTSTKNPSYSDLLYVEELSGPGTVNTMPPSVIEAFRDHGQPRSSLEEGIEDARETMKRLADSDISIEEVTDALLEDGVKLFVEAFDKLLNAVDKRCRENSMPKVKRLNYTLPWSLASQVNDTLEEWQKSGKVRKLWSGDTSLWTGTDEGDWVGWLHVTEDQPAHGKHLRDIATEVKEADFTNAVLLGMGGSSLCADVLSGTFGMIDGFPGFYVLDSVDPAQIKTVEDMVHLPETLFIVSSKSGTTLEPAVLLDYFFDSVSGITGPDNAGSSFIAITYPGSQLEEIARTRDFRKIFHGVPSIGGRYSALSNFGMVPAAVIGLDAPAFLDRADEMAVACSSCVPAAENPGVLLGVILGVCGTQGRDKVTIVASPGIGGLGAWLEQLLAESTGKQSKALIPVDKEEPGPPDVYGEDRLFVYMRLETAPDGVQDRAMERIEQSGQPVVRISVTHPFDLGQEFFRWEIATAVAGSVLGINPFDQPDVEASKEVTRELTGAFESTGALPDEFPILENDGMKLFTDEHNAEAIRKASGENRSIEGYLRAHLDRIGAGDYFALLAFIENDPAHEALLQEIRHMIRDRKHVATCLGFGPRFLHSTGQAYKGGPNSGVFVQVTGDDAVDMKVPGRAYTFGLVKAAEARGDFQVLVERDRRALRVHLGPDVRAGLIALREAVKSAFVKM